MNQSTNHSPRRLHQFSVCVAPPMIHWFLCTWAEDPEDTKFKIIRFVHGFMAAKGLQLWENTPLLQIAPLHLLLNSFIEIACILLSRNNEELHRGITIYKSFWGSKAENPMGRRRKRRNPNWQQKKMKAKQKPQWGEGEGEEKTGD